MVARYEYKPHGVGFIGSEREGWYVRVAEYDKLEAEVERLRAALSNLMPMLAECDCIYSDRTDPPCPCRAARNALAQGSSR